MFQAYTYVVRATYLSAIVLAPLFMAESLVQFIWTSSFNLRGLLWFLLFAALLCLPSARAWVRMRRGEALIPDSWLRTHWFLAAVVACICTLAALAVAGFVYARWIFEPPIPEGPEILPLMATLLLYSIVLPGCELLLAYQVRNA